MTDEQNFKSFDLEERTQQFALRCRDFMLILPKTTPNFEYGKQLIRSSGSTAANYIEANESLSRKDYFHRVRICRKEAKESRLWLNLSATSNTAALESIRQELIQETVELTKIFGSILEKAEL